MTTSVRPARPEDAAAILELIRRQAAYEGSPGAVALTEPVIRADAFGPDRRFEALLAEHSGKVVGVVTLYDAYSSWAGRPTLVIHDLFVAEGARGTGAGAALLAQAARLARDRGCCRMDVNVLDWNDGARRFYQRLGFAALAEWVPYRLDEAGMARLAP